jgi:hypothetical protein
VALFASDGWPPLTGPVGSAYLFCVAAFTPGKTSCAFSNSSYITYEETGGTSVSSPAMAGIMAMVLQKLGGTAQGLANPVLYELAAKDNLTNCDTNTVASGNSCVFYDITTGTNAQVCKTGSQDCVTETSGDKFGVASGYNSTVGYDLTTGLGSVNAYNLVNAWSDAIVPVTVSLTPGSLAFPSTKDGTGSAAQVVTLKNTSTATLEIASGGIALGGPNASAFSFTTTCGTTLAPGASCTISVTFKPTTVGTLNATLSVASNAAGSPQTVTLAGTGTGSTLITLSPASLTFPNTVAGATSEAQPVTITNAGTGTVTLTSISIAGSNPASFEQLNVCGASLAPGASCTALVAFKPVSAAAQKATLTIADNATGSPQAVTLGGTGTAAPSVTLSATSLAFPSTADGATSEEQSITLTNGGASTLEITGIALTGANAASFVEFSTCGVTLATAANCVIYVAFKPATTGTLTGTITIDDTGASSSQTVKLIGAGVS